MSRLWVTRYALTEGIRCYGESGWTHTVNGKYANVISGYSLLIIGKDAFLTSTEALADAEKRRVKKIAAVKKQLAKLEALRFDKELSP